MTNPSSNERVAFEKWARPKRYDLCLRADGTAYLWLYVECAWHSWQARATMRSDETSEARLLEKLNARIEEMRSALYTFGTYGESIGGPLLDGVQDEIDELLKQRSPVEPIRRHSRDCACTSCHYSKKFPQVKPHHATCGCFECAPEKATERRPLWCCDKCNCYNGPRDTCAHCGAPHSSENGNGDGHD